jgi:Flp pilus assembly pilin Flp
MNAMVLKLRMPRLLKDRKAIESSEVGVLLAAIIVVVYGAFTLLGGNVAEVVTRVANFIN